MALTTNAEIRLVFDLAIMRREARTIRTPREWRAVNSLMMRCRNARQRETELHKARYEARVEQRRLRLIDEAGTKHRDLTPVWGACDGFSPTATLRQARRDVEAAHQARLDRIEHYEHRQISEIMRDINSRNGLRGMAADAFNRAVDNSIGPNRPGPWSRER